MSIRLNKLLADRGVGARRKCDALIKDGAVRVNGQVVIAPGVRVEPDRDRIQVKGRPLPAQSVRRYYALHKPVGVISTLHDPEGRRTIRDFLPPGPRLFPVGRLDADTSGLLVLTNDGELAHHLMHPRYGVEKVYRVRLARAPEAHALERLRGGVEFEPGVWSAPAGVRILAPGREGCILEIVLHEGRYRQVRRMCEAVGLDVLSLHRAAYGPLRLGPLARGMWRELSDDEVRRLRAASARPRPRERGARGRLRAARAGADREGRGGAPRAEPRMRKVPIVARADRAGARMRSRDVRPPGRTNDAGARMRSRDVRASGGTYRASARMPGRDARAPGRTGGAGARMRSRDARGSARTDGGSARMGSRTMRTPGRTDRPTVRRRGETAWAASRFERTGQRRRGRNEAPTTRAAAGQNPRRAAAGHAGKSLRSRQGRPFRHT